MKEIKNRSIESNPFTISFGRKPQEYISRSPQADLIIDSFRGLHPVTQAYMISGVRGSGKTVLMTDISERLKEEGWIVIDLNPTVDMLRSLASRLYDTSGFHKEFMTAKINLSILGIGVSIEEVPPLSDYETAIARMMDVIKKKNKKVLLVIDEVQNSESVRQLVSAFQILIRKEYPLFLLMTGLHNNLNSLQNDNAITFLLRTPKVVLQPLNLPAVGESYQTVFGLDIQTASHMAAITKGYPFAYQVLGFLYWNRGGEPDDLLPDLDQYLSGFVYEKIWSELSARDQDVMDRMAGFSGEITVKDLRDQLQMTSQTFSVYRDRLSKKGLVNTDHYGYLSFSLPRFEFFVRRITSDRYY
ncbi:MAG: ATP-binding protein [Firmicutes bacterium]|nr:ATP-binding protein [Bacillota bacterium]